MYLLDTNVVSELRKAPSGRADPNVLRWIGARDPGDFHLSAISVLELELGVLSTERRDARQGAALRAWLERQVLVTFEHRILPVDTRVARRGAALHVPDRRAERDALIAATALVHAMSVVTRNVADFADTGVVTHEPWEAERSS